MATGTRLRYNLTSGTLGAPLGLDGTPSGFVDLSKITPNSDSVYSDTRGYEFSCDQASVRVTGLRIYHPRAITATLKLWRVSDQALLGTLNASTTVNQWVEVLFGTPVDLASGSNYVVTIDGDGGTMYKDETVTSADFLAAPDVYLSYVRARTGGTSGGFPGTLVAGRIYGIVDPITEQTTPEITINFGTDPGFSTIGASEYIPITVDNKEIVHLTSYTAGATTGTVERGQEGTTAVDNASGAAWLNGPTTQDFEVDELVGYSTLALDADVTAHTGGTDPHGDRAYTDSVLPVGGSLLEDAAADPLEGDGLTGDFHLRRDTGKLTGPKLTGYAFSNTGTPGGADNSSGQQRYAFNFTVTSAGTLGALTFNHRSGGTTLDVAILNSSRAVIGAIETVTVTSGQPFTVEFSSPVALDTGVQYYVGIKGASGFRLENLVDSTGASAESPLSFDASADYLRWDLDGADWTDAPNSTFEQVSTYIDFGFVGGSTWTGADSILIASRQLTVEDVGTATYTVVAADTGKVKRFTVDSTIDLPTGLAIGTVVELMAYSAGGITVQAGAGATVQNAGTVAQYKTCSAAVVATDTWVVTGTTGASSGLELLQVVSYNPGTQTSIGTTSATFVDIDATNLAITFIAPASGSVLLRLSAAAYQSVTGEAGVWSVREGTTDVANAIIGASHNSSYAARMAGAVEVTGLTPGQSYTWKWTHRSPTGTSTFTTRYGGPTVGPAVMEIWATP